MEMNTTALIGFRTRWETMFNQAFNLAGVDLKTHLVQRGNSAKMFTDVPD